MDYELAGIDINDFENKVKNDDTISPEFKLGATILIQRYKRLIDCNLTEYQILCNCMGGTNKLINEVNNNFRFEDLSGAISDIDSNNIIID